MKLSSTFTDLWQKHPAVLYAFTILLGSSAALYSMSWSTLFFSLSFLLFPFFTFIYSPSHFRLLLALTLGIASFCLAKNRYQFPEEKLIKNGIVDIEMSAIKTNKTPFGTMWSYKGILKSYTQGGILHAKNIPVLISVPFQNSQIHPPANFRYLFVGNLKKTVHGKYVITPKKNNPWHPLKKLNNLAEWRFSAKSKLQHYIQKSIQNHHVGTFLSGVATGEFDDRILAFELSRFGLQHLMAISGLHFSIISALFAVIFGMFFSQKNASIITLGLMSAYFLFLGASPSVTRAWIAILIGIASFFMERNHSGFNALGIAALIILLLNPLYIEDIGFQFSFGITAGILLWFSPFDECLQNIFAKRTLKDIVNVDLWDQHGYCILHFLRQGLALCFAVNLVALPLTLYHFHKFPLMSLIYNLFFPFLVSISLILLIIACASNLIFPWMGTQLHVINKFYTQFVLNFAFGLPKTFDITWQVKEIPKDLLLIYLIAIFFGGILLKNFSEKKQQALFPEPIVPLKSLKRPHFENVTL